MTKLTVTFRSFANASKKKALCAAHARPSGRPFVIDPQQRIKRVWDLLEIGTEFL
jgi:hypothetical protein